MFKWKFKWFKVRISFDSYVHSIHYSLPNKIFSGNNFTVITGDKQHQRAKKLKIYQHVPL